MLQYESGEKKLGVWPTLYGLWAISAIGFSVALAGFSAESVTRLMVIAFLFAQFVFRAKLIAVFSSLQSKIRFILLGMLLAAVVEGFHMISTPVFLSLRVGWNTSLMQVVINYGLDLLFTVPAYFAIFSVLWRLIRRYEYPLWPYVLIMGLAQTLGDGGLFFFLQSPMMMLFLPYPMTNYHAINVIPFLAVRDQLPLERNKSRRRYLAIPIVIVTYLICGALIKLAGRYFGLA